MSQARDGFIRQLDAGHEGHVGELRDSLSKLKLETRSQVEGLDEQGLSLVMPGLYQQIVATTVQLAAHLGLTVSLALEAVDEFRSGASISSFSRAVRDQMTETGVQMKRRHSSKIAKLVAEVEAQRLAWRHNHEFLSWLGFRRDDERYPAGDRRQRLEAFKVGSRLIQCRAGISELVGARLAVALESHDRFMLANRWHLSPNDEGAVERYVWPLMSYQPAETVLVEVARHDYDAAVDSDRGEEEIAELRARVGELLTDQLASALDDVPDENALLSCGIVG